MSVSVNRVPFSFIQCSSDYAKKIEEGKQIQEGTLYFTIDTKQILLGKDSKLLPMGKSTGIIFANKDTDSNNLDSKMEFELSDFDEEYQSNYPQPNDLIFNKDGCFYRVLEVDNIHIKTLRLTVAGGGGSGGGGGGSASISLVAHPDMLVEDAIIYGEKCEIVFEFWATIDGSSTGSGILEVIVNDVTKRKKNIKQSTSLNQYLIEDITSCLSAGENYIKIKCSDVYGNYKILQFSRTVVKLEIDDSELTAKGTKKIFSTATSNFNYSYTPLGVGEKTATFILKKDNQLIFSDVEIFSTTNTKRTKTFNNLTYGIYTLEVSMTTIVGEKTLEPVTAFYTILCTANAPNPLTERHQPMLASYLKEKEVTQGSQINFYYMLNDPAQEANCKVKLVVAYENELGDIVTYSISNERLVNSLEHDVWKIRDYPVSKSVYFSILYEYTDAMTGAQTSLSSATWAVKVTKSESSNDIIDSGLLIYLTANGRTNKENSETISTWAYGDYSTTFENVNWVNDRNSGTGWLSDNDGNSVLRLNGRSSATLNFQPFKYDPSQENNLIKSGYTLELDFAIRDVNNENAIAINCMNNSNVGFKVSANKITFRGTGTELSANFNEEERVKVSFVVESNNKTQEGEYVTTRLASIYLNGVLTSSKQYSPTETFSQTNPLNIVFGSEECSIDIYNIRAYNRALSSKEIVDNFIYDQPNIAIQKEYYDNNNIYDEYNQLSYKLLKEKNSVFTIIGDLPTYKGDKRDASFKYECLFDPNLSFEDNGTIDVQGTSSQYYIRKNFKIKCKNIHQHEANQIPTKVFCLKADYAEGTGTHNTQNANFVHSFYSEKTPAQKDDERCRTSIYGYPIVVFHQASFDEDPVFIGKYNFNFDKGSEEAFGFTKNYDVECWEFCNNDSNACNFLGKIPDNWKDDFEPRYLAPFKINEGLENELEISFDRIEELQELEKSEILTSAQRKELALQRTEAIKRFRALHDWVYSTSRKNATNKPLSEVIGQSSVTYGEGEFATTYTVDSEDYRLAKFKEEFEQHFDMHYTLVYYVYTFVALMVDQRAKNLFLTYWGKTTDSDGNEIGGKWQPWFYDSDTCFGLNNVGAMVYSYYNEDTDKYGEGNVYNGQESALWENFRLSFPKEIKEMYANLRQDKLKYSTFIDRFITQGSNQWCENIYNEDIEYKYIYPLKTGSLSEDGKEWIANDASHLPKIQGTGEEYLRYFVNKRLDYCDSKWFAGDYVDDYITIRIWTPDNVGGNVAANPTITVKPFNTMYTGVRYKANGTIKQQLTEANAEAIFSPVQSDFEDDAEDETVYDGKFNDTETAIYGASNLSSIGDLSACYPSYVDIGKATRLIELIIGNQTEGFYNNYLKEVSVGANKLLKKVDVSNCVKLSGTLDLSNCPNIEEIYAFGTILDMISLPASGHITTLKLPETLTTLILQNQPFISDFEIQSSNNLSSYKNLVNVLIENCPTIDTKNMLMEMVNNLAEDREELNIGFVGVDWTFPNASFLLSLLDNPKINGYDKTFHTLARKPYITGKCHIDTLTGAEMKRIKEKFSSELVITYNNLVSNLNCCIGGASNEAGENSYYYWNYNIGDSIDQSEYDSFRYIALPENTITDCTADILNTYFNKNGDRYVCIQNVEIVREINTPIKIYTESVVNGGSIPDPIKQGKITNIPKRFSSARYDYEFSGWSLVPNGEANINVFNKVTQDRDVYAAFIKTERKYNVFFYHAERNADIKTLTPIYSTSVVYGNDVPENEIPTPDTHNLTYPGADAQDYIFSNWSPEPKNIIEDTNCISQYVYTAYPVTRLIEKELIEYNSESLTNIGDYGFYNCIYLEKINTPNVISIGEMAFKGCQNLKTLILNTDSICILKSTNAFEDTLIASGQGAIYVNSDMVSSYQNNDMWKNYVIKSIDELEIMEVNN